MEHASAAHSDFGWPQTDAANKSVINAGNGVKPLENAPVVT